MFLMILGGVCEQTNTRRSEISDLILTFWYFEEGGKSVTITFAENRTSAQNVSEVSGEVEY